ncbi:MAG: hypothetical protein ACJ79H_05705 [Myxococcales bacterium]
MGCGARLPLYAKETHRMTIQSKLVSFISAGILGSALAAHAQNAAAPDPNIAPSTVEEELTLPQSSANDPQLATEPDPDVAPSIAGEDARLPPSPPNRRQLATDPDPDIARSDDTVIGQ